MAKKFPEVVCKFCQRKLGELTDTDYDRTHTCACGAKYFVHGQWDDGPYWDEVFGREVGENVEVREIKNFDVLTDFEGQDPATGERLNLVFARVIVPGRAFDYGQVSAEEQNQSGKRLCQKVRFTVRLAQGETVTKGRLDELLSSVLAQLFLESEGWDIREHTAVMAQSLADVPDPNSPETLVSELTVVLGRSSQPPEYSFEEIGLWGQRALQFLQKMQELL